MKLEDGDLNRPKRWYEQRPELHRAVLTLEQFPNDIQSIVARGVMLMAFKWFRAGDLLSTFKSVGKEKVMGLHKSKTKRRPYDQNHDLHQAMIYMYVLTHDEQDFMAKKIIELSRFILEYLKLCRGFEIEPTGEHVEKITEEYSNHVDGAERARLLLRQLKDELEKQVLLYKTQKKDGSRRLETEETGLKVREDEQVD